MLLHTMFSCHSYVFIISETLIHYDSSYCTVFERIVPTRSNMF